MAAYGAHMALVEREAAEAMARAKGRGLGEAVSGTARSGVAGAVGPGGRLRAEVRRRWMARAERCGTLEGYARLLELASKLGQRLRGRGRQRRTVEVTGPDGGPIRVEVEAALKKIYGKPLPGEVVEVEAECRVQSAESRSVPADVGGYRRAKHD